MNNNKLQINTIRLLVSLAVFGFASNVNAAGAEVHMDKKVKVVPYDKTLFSSDPVYDYEAYDVKKQMEIYGGKAAYDFPKPLIEIGGGIYDNGPIGQSSYIFGETNPVDHQFYVYGDWRTAFASNDFGLGAPVPNSGKQSLIATTLNLDIDWRLTGTERLHAFVKPLERNGSVTRRDISGDVDGVNTTEFSLKFETMFFEGDLGNILAGFSGGYSSTDMPFAFGLMPLIFQNGVWFDDAFTGLAFTIPHINSKALDISNMDITFFGGFDNATTALRGAAAVDEKDVSIYGFNMFIEANKGYWEIGYGLTQGDNPALDGQDYSNITVAFTKRYFNRLSNSIRVIVNTGQDETAILAAAGGPGQLTADGSLILIENSWVTSLPSTLVPYFNFFIGSGTPQSLARAGAAGGVLKNTGITFDTDALTGYPTLDASANDTSGGAIGLEYLFGLQEQIVVEVAMLKVNDTTSVAVDDQMAFGVRYQKAFDFTWIFRADAMVGKRDGQEDISGARIEIRKKF